MGAGRLRGHARFSPPQGRTSSPASSPISRARVHPEVVEHPSDGSSERGDRLRPRTGSAGMAAGTRAAARVGPRVGRRGTGAVADRVSSYPGPRLRPGGASVTVCSVLSSCT